MNNPSSYFYSNKNEFLILLIVFCHVLRYKTSFGNGLKAYTTDTMESFIILSYQVVVPTYHENICKRCMEVHMEDHTGPVLSI